MASKSSWFASSLVHCFETVRFFIIFNWNTYLFLRMCLATVPSSWVMKTAIIAGSFVADCCYLVAQSCWTLCSPMDSSLWDFPGKNTEVGCLFLLQGSSQPRYQTSVSCIGKQIFFFFFFGCTSGIISQIWAGAGPVGVCICTSHMKGRFSVHTYILFAVLSHDCLQILYHTVTREALSWDIYVNEDYLYKIIIY